MDDQVDITEEDDEAAWKRRREGLRAFVDTIANHVQTLALPESYLEAERCVRSLTVSDLALQLLPVVEADLLNENEAPAIKPIRRHIRVYADRVLDIVPRFPLPETFLEVERANRYALSADRMLAQLYGPAQMVAPKAVAGKPASRRGRPFSVEDEVEADEGDFEADEESWRKALMDRLYGMECDAARDKGFWDDGRPFDAEDPAVKPYLDMPKEPDVASGNWDPWRIELKRGLLSRYEDEDEEEDEEEEEDEDEVPQTVTPSEPSGEDSGPGIRSLSL